jgi:hypothetical protein
MFDYLKLRWKLWKLARLWEGIEGANAQRREEAKKRGTDRDELNDIEQYAAQDWWQHQDDVRAAHSRFLVAKASEMILPIPKFDDKTMWKDDPMGRTTLTELGINTLRSAVRAERKARLEMFLMWVPGVVGILGTLIGLAAILSGKK